MEVAIFSTKPYDKQFLEEANKKFGHKLHFFEDSLTDETVVFTQHIDAICVFVNDRISADLIKKLADNNVKLVALRCAGFNNVDIDAAYQHGIKVVRVPAYSPYAVAEHTLAMILTLNRKTHRAYNRVREGNFSLNGLIGFDLNGKSVGVIGTGRIGAIFCQMMQGLGCKVLAYDPFPNEDLKKSGVEYKSLPELYEVSDIITLKCPLVPETYHLINDDAVKQMKKGVMLINTSRGGLIDTNALVKGLKSGIIGYLGIDVYEQEEDIFYKDLSDVIIEDDLIMRLITFPNVLITSHQAFFTDTAMRNISDTTLENISQFEQEKSLINEVKPLQSKK
ncbi:MAG: 2-hydroxyacid dehydrogenase [Cyclobacteriaceae bacterium]